MITQTSDKSGIELLKRIPCFSGVGFEDAESLNVEERAYEKGETILLEGEVCPGLFVVKSGSVKLYRSSVFGEEQIVRIVRSEGCFECVPLLDGGLNPVSAETLSRSKLYLLSTEDFLRLLYTSRDVALNFFPILAGRLRALVGTVGDLSNRRIFPRLARLLSQMAEEKEGNLVVAPSLSLNQYHLACMLGCSRQLVNTYLKQMVQSGAIRIEGRQIIIEDLAKLTERD